MFKVVSYGIATYIERVVYPGGGHSGSSFGQPVNAGYLHVHFLFHLLHQLYRAEGTCHDTRTELDMSNMSNIGWFSSAMNMVGTP